MLNMNLVLESMNIDEYDIRLYASEGIKEKLSDFGEKLLGPDTNKIFLNSTEFKNAKNSFKDAKKLYFKKQYSEAKNLFAKSKKLFESVSNNAKSKYKHQAYKEVHSREIGAVVSNTTFAENVKRTRMNYGVVQRTVETCDRYILQCNKYLDAIENK